MPENRTNAQTIAGHQMAASLRSLRFCGRSMGNTKVAEPRKRVAKPRKRAAGRGVEKAPAGIRWVFGRLPWERGCQNPTIMSLVVLSRLYRIVIYTISLYKQLEITYYISSRYSRFLRFTPSQLLFYRMDHNQQQNDAGLLNFITPLPHPFNKEHFSNSCLLHLLAISRSASRS